MVISCYPHLTHLSRPRHPSPRRTCASAGHVVIDSHGSEFSLRLQSPTELWEKKPFQFTGAACL